MNRAERALLRQFLALGHGTRDATAATMGFQLACGLARLEPEWWRKRRVVLEGDEPVPAEFARRVRAAIEAEL